MVRHDMTLWRICSFMQSLQSIWNALHNIYTDSIIEWLIFNIWIYIFRLKAIVVVVDNVYLFLLSESNSSIPSQALI